MNKCQALLKKCLRVTIIQERHTRVAQMCLFGRGKWTLLRVWCTKSLRVCWPSQLWVDQMTLLRKVLYPGLTRAQLICSRRLTRVFANSSLNKSRNLGLLLLCTPMVRTQQVEIKSHGWGLVSFYLVNWAGLQIATKTIHLKSVRPNLRTG